VNDVGTAADPVHHEHARSHGWPYFKSEPLRRFATDRAARRRARNDDLQIAKLEETRLDMLVNALEGGFDKRPERTNEEFLQASGRSRRSSGRWGHRDRGVSLRDALARAAALRPRWQSQG
jgi:hypothetical protein